MSNEELLTASLLAMMDGLRWEGNTFFKLGISSIYRADQEKKGRKDS